MSKDPDQEYICDGITETIITVLSHINNLLVFLKKAIRLNPIPPLDYLFRFRMGIPNFKTVRQSNRNLRNVSETPI